MRALAMGWGSLLCFLSEASDVVNLVEHPFAGTDGLSYTMIVNLLAVLVADEIVLFDLLVTAWAFSTDWVWHIGVALLIRCWGKDLAGGSHRVLARCLQLF